MERFYKPYLSDDSESESDGYTSEESLLNVPGKNKPINTQTPGKSDLSSDTPPKEVGTKFETQEVKNTSLITINSRDRDTSVYPQPTFFTLRLPRVFKSVKTVNLSQLNLLNSFFNFSKSFGNTFFWVEEFGREPIQIFIRDGTYSSDELVEELNNALNATSLFANITLGSFINNFQSTGDYTILFNTPGPVVYNSLTQSYDRNVTINDIVARYFTVQQTVGTVNFPYNQCLVAYYYPVLKEMVASGRTDLVFQPPFSTYNEFYNYVIFQFTGIADTNILTIVSNPSNQILLQQYHDENTFLNKLVNKYTCTYNNKQGRLIISAPSLNDSITNDLNTQYNFYLTTAVLSNSNFVDLNDFNNQYAAISNQNVAVLNLYNFIQSRFTSNFGVNYGAYTAEFYANISNVIYLYNTSNKYGWAPNLTASVNSNAISSNQPPLQQTVLCSNIRFLSTMFTANDFISTVFTTTNLTFSNGGEDTLGFFDIQFNLEPTTYKRIVFKSPIRQDISVMTIPRYLCNYTPSNDMIFNLSTTTTPKIVDVKYNPPSVISTLYYRTDISGNNLFHLYTVEQSMFYTPDYFRIFDNWANNMYPQILSGIRLQPGNPNFHAPPPINDITINSYRQILSFEVIGGAYIIDSNAHFNITFWVETQSGQNFPIPLTITWYKDRAAFMADLQNNLNGPPGIGENPFHYFLTSNFDSNTSSIQMIVDINNYQHTYFQVHPQLGFPAPSDLPLRVFATLTDTYGTYSTATRTDKFDLPFSSYGALETQSTPITELIADLPSIYNSTVTIIGYDINNVSNNLLDYTIQAGNNNFYDPLAIQDYVGDQNSGLRYQFIQQNNGSQSPPPNLAAINPPSAISTWSLFFDVGSSNYIRDTYDINNTLYLSNPNPSQKARQLSTNQFTMVNWWAPTNANNPERYWLPPSSYTYPSSISNVNFIGDYSIFLPASNSPALVQDMVTSSYSATSYTDMSGFSGIGFFLPPGEIVNINQLVLKFVYTQPSFDSAGNLFTRSYTPMIYTNISTINNELFYRNQTTSTEVITSNINDYEDWDDWYFKNRQNMKIGIFRTADISNFSTQNILLSNALLSLTLTQVTQVNNYQNVNGTLQSREPDWGTYYVYSYTSTISDRYVPSYSIWDSVTSTLSSFYVNTFDPDFSPTFTEGGTDYPGYFRTPTNLFNYTFLERSFGLSPSIANAIDNPLTTSTINADIPNSYIAIPFVFDSNTSTYSVGSFYGISFTFLPGLPSTYQMGASPYYGPMGPFGWTNNSNVLGIMSTGTSSLTKYYWMSKLSWSALDFSYNPVGDLAVFGGFSSIQTEYQNTVLFAYKNTIPGSDYSDVLSTVFLSTFWKWGQESSKKYIAFDSNKGYNNLSYIQNIPVEQGVEYALHVRAYDPIPSFTTGVRIIGKGYTDFGSVSLSGLAQEISSLQGYNPISEVSSVYFNYELLNNSTIQYNQIISTNTFYRFQGSNRFSIPYANALINFDRSFSTTATFGKTITYPGLTFTFTGYKDCISTYASTLNGTRNILSTYTDILNIAYSQLATYVQTRYSNILPSSIINRTRFTDPLPFSFLFSTKTLPPYSYSPIDWGLGYNIGFNKVDTPSRTTITSDTFIRIVQNYIFLRISPELNLNTMGASGQEMLSECRDSAAQEAKFFSKILLNNFGSFTQTAVQRPKDFNPVLGKYETLTCQLTDKYGNQLNNIDCEYDFVLQIDELSNAPKDTSSLLSPTSDLNVYSL